MGSSFSSGWPATVGRLRRVTVRREAPAVELASSFGFPLHLNPRCSEQSGVLLRHVAEFSTGVAEAEPVISLPLALPRRPALDGRSFPNQRNRSAKVRFVDPGGVGLDLEGKISYGHLGTIQSSRPCRRWNFLGKVPCFLGLVLHLLHTLLVLAACLLARLFDPALIVLDLSLPNFALGIVNRSYVRAWFAGQPAESGRILEGRES
jgi:hypothetical protein